MKLRYINHQANNAYMNMAIDEAILKLGKKPTLRLYTWKPAAISIGYFQSLKEEVDLEKCKEYNVDFVRRITGGGAVFHDDELTYSFVIPVENELIPTGILESYKKISQGVIEGLSLLNLKTEFVPLNDLIVNGKKISGNAQTRKQGKILQHGTILIDVDVKKMFSLLLIPDEKIRDKLINDVSERVTSIKKEHGDVDINELKEKIRKGFEKALNVEFVEEELTQEEKELAEKIAKEKFSTEDWNFMR